MNPDALVVGERVLTGQEVADLLARLERYEQALQGIASTAEHLKAIQERMDSGESMSVTEQKAVLAYLRALSPPVPEDVARDREEEAGRLFNRVCDGIGPLDAETFQVLCELRDLAEKDTAQGHALAERVKALEAEHQRLSAHHAQRCEERNAAVARAEAAERKVAELEAECDSLRTDEELERRGTMLLRNKYGASETETLAGMIDRLATDARRFREACERAGDDSVDEVAREAFDRACAARHSVDSAMYLAVRKALRYALAMDAPTGPGGGEKADATTLCARCGKSRAEHDLNIGAMEWRCVIPGSYLFQPTTPPAPAGLLEAVGPAVERWRPLVAQGVIVKDGIRLHDIIAAYDAAKAQPTVPLATLAAVVETVEAARNVLAAPSAFSTAARLFAVKELDKVLRRVSSGEAPEALTKARVVEVLRHLHDCVGSTIPEYDRGYRDCLSATSSMLGLSLDAPKETPTPTTPPLVDVTCAAGVHVRQPGDKTCRCGAKRYGEQPAQPAPDVVWEGDGVRVIGWSDGDVTSMSLEGGDWRALGACYSVETLRRTNDVLARALAEARREAKASARKAAEDMRAAAKKVVESVFHETDSDDAQHALGKVEVRIRALPLPGEGN